LNNLKEKWFDLDDKIDDLEDNPTVSSKKLTKYRKRRQELRNEIQALEQKMYKKARTEARNEQKQDDEDEEDEDDSNEEDQDEDGEDESDGDDE
jgi:hypothetical protein